MKKFDWKKYIYKIVVVILVVFFVGGVGIGAKNILAIEGTYELYTPAEPLTPFPATDEDVISFVNSAIEGALKTKPLTEQSEFYSINTDSIANSADNAQLTASAKFAAGKIEDAVKESSASNTADYGKDASAFLSVLNISADDIESTEVNYKYYKCSMCESGISVEDYAEECPECGNENTLNERYSDEYEIVIKVKPQSEAFKSNAFPKSESLSKIVADNGGDYYKLDKLDSEVTACTVYATVNRLTNEIKSLSFETDSKLTANLGFLGAYADIGKAEISTEANAGNRYSFTWPGVALDKDEFTVELGSSENLKATLTCDNPIEYTVKWSSDNEDVLTVDDEGYLKTHKKFGDATVTASFIFNGKTYSDTCLIHVGVPAEGVDLNKGKLSLKKGETFELKAKFDPKDSTNTVCYWFTNDESVAKIDDNGVVTAVGKGSTVVYVVTDYGNYYSSCEVEVTG